eukprot:Gb_33914 [translate_table: standard]
MATFATWLKEMVEAWLRELWPCLTGASFDSAFNPPSTEPLEEVKLHEEAIRRTSVKVQREKKEIIIHGCWKRGFLGSKVHFHQVLREVVEEEIVDEEANRIMNSCASSSLGTKNSAYSSVEAIGRKALRFTLFWCLKHLSTNLGADKGSW